jgi:arylsulfatase A-like enzyme
MIRDPRLPASTRGHRSQMVLNIDIAPTIVTMAGLSVPTEMQGMHLGPILRDPEVQGRTDWYYEHDVESESQGKPLPRCEGVRFERWKYIRYKDTQPLQEELFDLQNDPLEENNLAKEAAHAATLAKMSARCDELRKELR